MKNKAISLILAFVFLLSPITAFAEGDGNVDSGSGGMGTPIDYTNITPANNIQHFGKNQNFII